MNRVQKNKIELICYCSDGISYKKHNNKYVLDTPLSFIPCDLFFSEKEMSNIVKLLLNRSGKIKVTLEID